MCSEEQRLHRLRRERIARAKRILRWLPRRTNLHSYPVLRLFAKAARKRLYLWSFRSQAVIPALYGGFILSLQPLYGIQLPISVGLAFLFRANLPILFALQFISNPFTFIPVYYTNYQIARLILDSLGVDTPSVNMDQLARILNRLSEGEWMANFQFMATVFGLTAFGGLVLSTALGATAVALYRFSAYEVSRTNERIRQFQQARQKKKES